MKRAAYYLLIIFAFILSSACTSGEESQSTPTPVQVPIVEEDPPASIETSETTEEEPTGNWIQIEFSTSSDWADLYFLTPDQLLSFEIVSLLGDPSEHMAKIDQLMLYQGIDAAESGAVVGITVDFELSVPLEELLLDFRSERGDLNESYLRIFDLRGDQPELFLEVNHTLSNDDQGKLDFSLGIGEEVQMVSEERSNEEWIFFNGTILTMEDNAINTAIIVQNEFILKVGSDEEILALSHPNTNLIDLEGKTLMPGFVDAHSHVFNNPWRDDLEGGQELLLSNGITTSAEMFVEEALILDMQALDQQENLRVRVSLYPVHVDNCGEIRGDWYSQKYPVSREAGAMLQIPGIKVFNDGGTCNAPAVSFKYGGGIGSGDLYFQAEELAGIISEAQNLGYQVAIHSSGDRAVESSHQAIGDLLENGKNPFRHRIEHNVLVRDEMLTWYTDNDSVALLFGFYPTCWYTSDFDQSRYATPPQYIDWRWRWRDLLDANPDAHFAWHSDSPYLGNPAPMEHLFSYVTRKQVLEDGTVCEPPEWAADDLLTVEEALLMMTIESAYALLRDNEIGSLKPGKLADLIILSDNPLDVELADILNIQVLMTLVGGQVEHCAGGYERFCPNTP